MSIFKIAACVWLLCLETSALKDGPSQTITELLHMIDELKERMTSVESTLKNRKYCFCAFC